MDEGVKPEVSTDSAVEVAYTKEQLISCKQFNNRKDVLCAVLEDKKEYTIEQAQSEINKYMKGKVK